MGVEIVFESISIRTKVVETTLGVHESKPCLVVRIKSQNDKSSNQKFWVKPVGLEFEGYEGRTYEDIGSYTGTFWPIVADEVDQVISGLNVYSLDDMKRQAESRGFHIRLDNLGSPRADDIAFPPLNGPAK